MSNEKASGNKGNSGITVTAILNALFSRENLRTLFSARTMKMVLCGLAAIYAPEPVVGIRFPGSAGKVEFSPVTGLPIRFTDLDSANFNGYTAEVQRGDCRATITSSPIPTIPALVQEGPYPAGFYRNCDISPDNPFAQHPVYADLLNHFGVRGSGHPLSAQEAYISRIQGSGSWGAQPFAGDNQGRADAYNIRDASIIGDLSGIHNNQKPCTLEIARKPNSPDLDIQHASVKNCEDVLVGFRVDPEYKDGTKITRVPDGSQDQGGIAFFGSNGCFAVVTPTEGGRSKVTSATHCNVDYSLKEKVDSSVKDRDLPSVVLTLSPKDGIALSQGIASVPGAASSQKK